MTNTTAIIKKIQALLRLSESANEHEAAVALQKAQALLTEHHLSMESVNVEEDHDPVTWSSTYAGKNRGMPDRWKDFLAFCIAEIYYCRQLHTTGPHKKVIFVGRTSNVQVALHAYEQLSVRLFELEKAVWKEKLARYKDHNNESFYGRHKGASGARSMHRKDWIMGAAIAIHHRLTQHRKPHGAFEMQLRFKQENDAFIDKTWNNVRQGKEIITNAREVLQQGYAAGQHIEIHAGLEGSPRKELPS